MAIQNQSKMVFRSYLISTSYHVMNVSSTKAAADFLLYALSGTRTQRANLDEAAIFLHACFLYAQSIIAQSARCLYAFVCMSSYIHAFYVYYALKHADRSLTLSTATQFDCVVRQHELRRLLFPATVCPRLESNPKPLLHHGPSAHPHLVPQRRCERRP